MVADLESSFDERGALTHRMVVAVRHYTDSEQPAAVQSRNAGLSAGWAGPSASWAGPVLSELGRAECYCISSCVLSAVPQARPPRCKS